MNALAEPEVLKCYVDDGCHPHQPAMRLRWRVDRGGPSERMWYLPDGVCLLGPAPEHFGVNIHRRAADAYTVRLVWNKTRLWSWRPDVDNAFAALRTALMDSSTLTDREFAVLVTSTAGETPFGQLRPYPITIAELGDGSGAIALMTKAGLL